MGRHDERLGPRRHRRLRRWPGPGGAGPASARGRRRRGRRGTPGPGAPSAAMRRAASAERDLHDRIAALVDTDVVATAHPDSASGSARCHGLGCRAGSPRLRCPVDTAGSTAKASWGSASAAPGGRSAAWSRSALLEPGPSWRRRSATRTAPWRARSRGRPPPPVTVSKARRSSASANRSIASASTSRSTSLTRPPAGTGGRWRSAAGGRRGRPAAAGLGHQPSSSQRRSASITSISGNDHTKRSTWSSTSAT